MCVLKDNRLDIRADDLDTVAPPSSDKTLKERYDAVQQIVAVISRTCPSEMLIAYAYNKV